MIKKFLFKFLFKKTIEGLLRRVESSKLPVAYKDGDSLLRDKNRWTDVGYNNGIYEVIRVLNK